MKAESDSSVDKVEKRKEQEMGKISDISKMDLSGIESPDNLHDSDEELTQNEELDTGETTASAEADSSEADSFETSEDAETVGQEEETEEEAPKEEYDIHKIEPNGENYYIEADIGEQELSEFLMKFNYHSPLILACTIISILWPILAIVRGRGTKDIIYGALMCVFFIVVLPVMTLFRAKTAKKKGSIYAHPFIYLLDEDMLRAQVENAHAEIEWKKITKVWELKRSMVFFIGRNNAFVIPYKNMNGQEEQIKALVKRVRPSKKGK